MDEGVYQCRGPAPANLHQVDSCRRLPGGLHWIGPVGFPVG
jgi:hypothetical protein